MPSYLHATLTHSETGAVTLWLDEGLRDRISPVSWRFHPSDRGALESISMARKTKAQNQLAQFKLL